MSPVMPGAPEAGTGRKDHPLEPLEGVWSCPAWISGALPLLDLSGPALPGSQGSCPAWISGVLPSWISAALPRLDLRLLVSTAGGG